MNAHIVPEVDIELKRVSTLGVGAIVWNLGDVVEVVEVYAVDLACRGHGDEVGGEMFRSRSRGAQGC
jgi:hypothetical protein